MNWYKVWHYCIKFSICFQMEPDEILISYAKLIVSRALLFPNLEFVHVSGSLVGKLVLIYNLNSKPAATLCKT